MRNTSTPGRPSHLGRKIALAGASLAAAATGVGLLGVGAASAQAPRPSATALHEQRASVDRPGHDHQVRTSEVAGTLTVKKVVQERTTSIDRPGADRHETKQADLKEHTRDQAREHVRSSDPVSLDRTAASGSATVHDR